MSHRDARPVDGVVGREPDRRGADSPNQGTSGRHLLLTVLGTNPKPARYAIEGREAEAPLAALALLELLKEEDRPDRVLALCTPEAEQASLPLLERTLGDRIPVETLRVPAGDAQEHVNVFLEKVIRGVGSKVELTVDVTHGFRHFSFLTYIAVLYLAALRSVTIRGAYYGMLNPAGPDHSSPFLDLRPLLELPRWAYALDVLWDTGSTLPMAKNLLRDGQGERRAKAIARDLTGLSEAYLSALPLEFGKQARDVLAERREPLRRLLVGKEHRLPLAKELVDELANILKPYAIEAPKCKDRWKRKVRLDTTELSRQACIIDSLLKHENLATALRLMREWVVSWAVYRQATCEDWLDRTVRHRKERILHAIRAITHDGELRCRLDETQQQLGRFWDDLTEIRNAYAHHGMGREYPVRGDKAASTRNRVLEYWRKTLRSCPDISLSIGGSPGRRVLVSPIGQRPGVLFSAVHAVRTRSGEPSFCLVIASHETAGMIAEALECAGFTGDWKALVLEDAFAGGRAEIERIARDAREHFIGAGKVFVNVTGGTTLMGLGAEQLADKARSFECPVYRFGLIDRRSTQQQDADPYRTGEPFWLDSPEDSDDDRD